MKFGLFLSVAFYKVLLLYVTTFMTGAVVGFSYFILMDAHLEGETDQAVYPQYLEIQSRVYSIFSGLR